MIPRLYLLILEFYPNPPNKAQSSGSIPGLIHRLKKIDRHRDTDTKGLGIDGFNTIPILPCLSLSQTHPISSASIIFRNCNLVCNTRWPKQNVLSQEISVQTDQKFQRFCQICGNNHRKRER